MPKRERSADHPFQRGRQICLYKDERYASDFIEELLILDAFGISDYAITHLTNNMMLETQFLRVDVCSEIEKLVKMELKI